MRWPTSSQQATVTLQIEIEFGWVRNLAIDHGAGRAITTPISGLGVLREEPDVVALANNNQGDLRFNA